MAYTPFYEAVRILSESESPATHGYELQKITAILEDVNSPVTRKYHEKLFQSVIDKKHVDFGDIPNSAGQIKAYSGYNTMVETLAVLSKLAKEERNNEVEKYIKIVTDAIANIESLSSSYTKGFMMKSEYVKVEYNTYVYTCVEATTSLLYEFADYIKRPDQMTMKITLKNNKFRANGFYFQQLSNFNNVVNKMGTEYRKMLETMAAKEKSNFLGVDELVGAAAISMVALAIVPITRELVYQVYKLRGNLANSLEMQVAFLDMNRTCLEANTALTVDKKKKILDRQMKMRNQLYRLGEMLRVKNVKATTDAKRDIASSNKMLSIDSLRDEVSNSPLEIF